MVTPVVVTMHPPECPDGVAAATRSSCTTDGVTHAVAAMVLPPMSSRRRLVPVIDSKSDELSVF